MKSGIHSNNGNQTKAARFKENRDPGSAYKTRTDKAQQLHTFVMASCNATNEKDLEKNLSNIKYFIDINASAILLERSANQDSHLNDALHLPFSCQQNKQFAQIISCRLFDLLVHKMKKRLHNDQFPRLMLQNRTKDGFMVLHCAVKSAYPDMVAKVITLLEEHPEALKANLLNITQDGFMVLQHAL
ncbi:MAG: hypothetical protein JSR17_02445, partial [Proteobacteria bacterium]|nr:hypothetical protein [Pseudomonadota bacterium]